MIRAASVGLGWWSKELATAIQGSSDIIRITGCASRSADKRATFAETFGTVQHESYAAALADPDIDAVILTTPHSQHAEHVIQAAEAGKHVFVEKPLSMSAESARQAAAACARAGVILAVGHNRRYAPAVIAIKTMLEDGEFGTVLHAEANFSVRNGFNYRPEAWRSNRGESPAGGLAGLGVHMIDTLVWFLGRVVRTTAQTTRRAMPVDLEDTTSALLEFESGATGYIADMLVCPFTSFVNVYGTEANAFAQIDGNALSVQGVEGKPVSRPIEPVDTLKAELEEFARAASAGSQAAYRIRPEEAVHTVEVMEAMVASAYGGGQPVTIPAQAAA